MLLLLLLQLGRLIVARPEMSLMKDTWPAVVGMGAYSRGGEGVPTAATAPCDPTITPAFGPAAAGTAAELPAPLPPPAAAAAAADTSVLPEPPATEPVTAAAAAAVPGRDSGAGSCLSALLLLLLLAAPRAPGGSSCRWVSANDMREVPREAPEGVNANGSWGLLLI